MEKIPVKDEDVFVEIIDLGNTEVPEVVHKNEDGTYTIFLNARFSFDRLQESCKHAISHIENGDFEPGDVQIIESVAHGEHVPTPEEVQASLRKEAFEKRRKAAIRRSKKFKKKLAEYENFANELRSSSPDAFDSWQNDLVFRY